MTRLAQVSKAKENVSDYAPLFEQADEYEQQLQNPNPVSKIDYRAVGDRIGKHIAEQLAAVESGNSDEHRTINPLETPEQGFEELSAALESYLEPLARAIAGYCNQRDLIRCAGDLSDAATAINLGLEQLEQSAKKRVELTAAVDRLNRALGETVRQLVSVGEPNSVQSPEQPGALADISGEATKGQQLSPPDHEERKAQRANLWKADFQSSTPDSRLPTPASQAPTQLSPRQRYQKMWARYSQNVEADTPVRLDYRVCRRAFEDGQSFKDVALMLAAGSPYVHFTYIGWRRRKARRRVEFM